MSINLLPAAGGGIVATERGCGSRPGTFIVVAENVSGVTDVRDHLVWIEPMSEMVVPLEDTNATQTKAS
jgi:hypothetical protein